METGLHSAEGSYNLIEVTIGAVLVALVVLAMLWRRYIPNFPLSRSFVRDPHSRFTDLSAFGARWLIGLRWIAWLVSTIVIVVVVQVLRLIDEPSVIVPLFLCLAALAVTNLLYSFLQNRWSSDRLIRVQIIVDLCILTVMLHLSGGSENPVFFIYIFHVIIASILLSRREAFGITALVCLLFWGLLVLEGFELIPHYTLLIYPHYGMKHIAHYGPFIFSIAGIFGLTMGLTAYFCTEITEALREGFQRERETIARAMDSAKLAALGEMAAGVAHEVNNPLASIIAAVERLELSRQVNLPEKFTSYLEMIRTDAERARKVVTNLLSFSRSRPSHLEYLDVRSILAYIKQEGSKLRQQQDTTGVLQDTAVVIPSSKEPKK